MEENDNKAGKAERVQGRRCHLEMDVRPFLAAQQLGTLCFHCRRHEFDP